VSAGVDRTLIRAAVVAALATSASAFALMTSDLIGFFFDDAIYALVAKALAEGKGFVYPHLPGEPAAIHYPPLWSLVLSLGFRFGPEFPLNAGWLRMLNPLLIGVAAFLATIFAARQLGLRPVVASALTLLAFVSIQVQWLVNTLLSETLFLVLAFSALLLAERARRSAGAGLWIAVGFVVGLAVLTRTLGVALAGGILLSLLWERRWRDTALFGLAVALTMLPWQMYVARTAPVFPVEILGAYGPYLDYVLSGYREAGLGLVLEVSRKNLIETWQFAGVPLQPFGPVAWRGALVVLAIALGVAGLVAMLRNASLRSFAIAVVLYTGAVMVWPFQVERFLWAIWPMYLFMVAAGAQALLAWQPASGARAVHAAVWVVGSTLALGNLAYNANGMRKDHIGKAPEVLAYRNLRVVRYVNSREDLHGKVIAADVAPMVALYTGEMVVPTGDLKVEDHLRNPSIPESASRLVRIDARYRPVAYVFLRAPGLARALQAATFVEGRVFTEVASGDDSIQLFLLQTP
jgi:4-amino-4-deoxy-L-arabinose transferase-like glycosyltransferase